MIAGFVLSSACMLGLDAITGGIDWALLLGIPILLAATIVIIFVLIIIESSKYKGVNLLAWGFFGCRDSEYFY
jgi:hypothetical protein